jgi:hypothetical protein
MLHFHIVILKVFMLSVIMLSVVMLNVIMLSVIMLSAIMLSVVAKFKELFQEHISLSLTQKTTRSPLLMRVG